MGLVLAIEPDASQAEAIRLMVRDRVGAELVLVTSVYAAVVSLNRTIPDLVLVGNSVTGKNQTQVVEHLRSLCDGVVPTSVDFTPEQTYLAPPEHQTDIVHVIKGVIEAETGAIEHYNRIIELTDGLDFVTQDMVIAILHDEEGHRRLFEGYLREYEVEGLA